MDIKILIFEDNHFVSEEIRVHLQKAGYKHIDVASTFNDAISHLNVNFPDLAILDIQTPEDHLAGIKLANEIQKNKRIPIIYVTGFYGDEYIKSSAFSTDPVAFLPKPFDENTLLNQIDLAVHKLKQFEADSWDSESEQKIASILDDSIFIKDKGVFCRLPINDIRFVKADHGCIQIYYGDNNLKYTHSATLSTFQSWIKDDSLVKVSRKYIINISKITAFSDKVIIIGTENIKINAYIYDKLMKVCAILKTKK